MHECTTAYNNACLMAKTTRKVRSVKM